MVNWKGSSCLEVSKHDSNLQEVWEGGSGELQSCQSGLSVRGSYRADYPNYDHMGRIGQSSDQKQLAYVYEGQVLPD